MREKLQSLFPLACFLLFLSFPSLHAPLHARGQVKPEKSPDPYCEAPCAKCAQIWPSHGPDWIITPNAGPCVECGFDVHVTGEFLYWTAREDHLAFAYKQTLGEQGTVASKGTTYHPDWNFRPGFKVGIGMLRNHDGWDVYANYTWLLVSDTKTTTTKTKSSQQISLIGDLPFAPLDSSTILSSSGQWKLDFNVVDLELGRNFFISRYLTLRPHFGVKGTWQKQSFLVETEFEPQGNDPFDLQKAKNNLDYWGIGLRTGVDMAWHFNKCTSLLGKVAVSGLWEKFCVENETTRALSTDAEGKKLTFLNVENSFFTLKPVLELFLGLRWETWFCCEAFHFSIEGGWEEQWWDDQNQFFSSSNESKEGDLYLHGLTIKLRIDF